MKRICTLGLAIIFGCMLTGCGPETREGLVTDTIERMKIATIEVGAITAKVNEAVEEAKKPGGKLNLKAATIQAEKLKETGVKIVEIKQRIDMIRANVTESEQKSYAESQRESLNAAFKNLLTKKEELRTALNAAEAFDSVQVAALRQKIVDAESPFEAQAR